VPEAGEGSLHESVMVNEVLENLDIGEGGKHLECGVSTGGHLLEIASRLGANGFALAIDLDEDALSIARKRLEDKGISCKIEFICGNYADLPVHLSQKGIEPGFFDTALLDAGVSGFQLKGDRGFSYSRDLPLDMRYGKAQKVTAESILNGADVGELRRIFAEYGDLHDAAKVAWAIYTARQHTPLATTGDLVKALQDVYPERMPHGKRMRRLGQVFMAVREAVNEGQRSLEGGIDNSIQYLRKDEGRFALLTFSGNENLIMKRIAARYRRPGKFNPDWILKKVTNRAVKPTRDEVRRNPASHSAMLRVFKKLPVSKVEV